MFVASLGSGMAMIVRGFGGDVGFDGTIIDLADALLLWLLISFIPIGLLTAFIFLPIVFLLDIHGTREFPAYLAAGAATGAIPVILFSGGLPTGSAWLNIFVLPGAAAGLTWWFLAIDRHDALARVDPGRQA